MILVAHRILFTYQDPVLLYTIVESCSENARHEIANRGEVMAPIKLYSAFSKLIEKYLEPFYIIALLSSSYKSSMGGLTNCGLISDNSSYYRSAPTLSAKV